MANEKRSAEPTDRMTRLCAAMTDALEAHPEYGEDVKCCVFLDNGKQAGLTLNNYEDDAHAMADLLHHLKVLFKANGKRMDIVFLGEDGVDRV